MLFLVLSDCELGVKVRAVGSRAWNGLLGEVVEVFVFVILLVSSDFVEVWEVSSCWLLVW